MAAEDKVEFEGKEYILSKDAALATEYTQDYVGQLARSGDILARRVGGLWYVNLESLRNHRKESQAEVGEESSEVSKSDDKSSIVLNGKEHLSSKYAAELTGYTQDYVGQLARAGKVAGTRVGGHWYVSKSDIEAHKREKDAQLAGAQSASTGIHIDAQVTLSPKELPLLKYVTEEGGSGVPELTPKPRLEARDTENLGISESRIEENEGETDDYDKETHIAIRAMHTDSARAKKAEENTKYKEEKRSNSQYHSPRLSPHADNWKNKQKNSSNWLRNLIFAVLLVVFIGAASYFAVFYLKNDKDFAPYYKNNVTRSLYGAVTGFVEVLADIITPGVTYKR